MKKLLFTLLTCLMVATSFASSVLIEGFEYANHDLTPPVGWVCNDNSWLCGYLDKDHNRMPHTGNWYAFTDTDNSWMFMELNMSSELKYRYSFWTISDGEYEVEFWAGSGPSQSEMTTLLFSETVNANEYERLSKYIDDIAMDYQYFGIHAVAHEGAYCLTIDDIYVEMVNKYDILATPTNADTVLYPNSQATYHFEVQNLGYEPIEVIISTIQENFTDIHFYIEGVQGTTFHLEPDQTKHITMEATLEPTIQPGTLCWIDVHLTLDCDCATTMTTLWVTVLDPYETAEFTDEEDLSQMEVFDLTGKKVDASRLKPGIYIVRTVSAKGSSVRKIVKQ